MLCYAPYENNWDIFRLQAPGSAVYDQSVPLVGHPPLRRLKGLLDREKILLELLDPRGLCRYLYGELRLLFPEKNVWGKQKLLKLQRNPVKSCPGCWRGPGKWKRWFRWLKNVSYEPCSGHSLTARKMSISRQSEDKLWWVRFLILIFLIWAQVIWIPYLPRKGIMTQSKLKCTFQIHSVLWRFIRLNLLALCDPTHKSYTASICQEDSEETCSETCYHFCCRHGKDMTNPTNH